jgi:hypothetical protein
VLRIVQFEVIKARYVVRHRAASYKSKELKILRFEELSKIVTVPWVSDGPDVAIAAQASAIQFG